GERLGQATLADLLLRALDRIGDAAVERPLGVEVEDEVGGARVAVARLADGARVEEEAPARQVDLRAAGHGRAVDRPVLEHDGEGAVAVADEDARRGGAAAGRPRRLP